MVYVYFSTHDWIMNDYTPLDEWLRSYKIEFYYIELKYNNNAHYRIYKVAKDKYTSSIMHIIYSDKSKPSYYVPFGDDKVYKITEITTIEKVAEIEKLYNDKWFVGYHPLVRSAYDF